MINKILITAITLFTLTFLVFIILPKQDIVKLPNFESINNFSTGLQESVRPAVELLPKPLSKRTGVSNQESPLTASEVIALSNTEREKAGLPPLKQNSRLERAALAKVDDMVAQQYFEHESPDGKGPSDLAEAAGYAYIVVGENLAEGDFTSSKDLVDGWMNSPGHRANILNERFEEIGVAVRIDTLFGKKVWIAVQEFGKPLSSCPGINEALKSQIAQDQARASTLENELTTLKASMDQAQAEGRVEFYNSQVPIYNQKVASYNTLVESIKADVASYNLSVQAFNACIAK